MAIFAATYRNITEVTDSIILTFYPFNEKQLKVTVNNTFLIPGVGYNVFGNKVTFTDKLEPGDHVYIRKG